MFAHNIMPPMKRNYRRKAGKKSSRPTKHKGKASQNTKVDARLNIVTNGIVEIGVGAVTGVDNYTLGYISALGPYSVSSGGSFWQNSDFITQKALYDEVCIKSYTVKFTPVINTVNLYDQSFAITTPSKQTRLQPNMYTWFDRDSSPLTKISDDLPKKLGQYNSFKQHNCLKPWSRTLVMKPIWLPVDSVAGGSHTSSESTIPLLQAGLLGNFGIYGQNLPFGGSLVAGTNESYGQLRVTWSFAFRGKRALNASVVDGVVTLTPADRYAPIQPTLRFTPVNDSGGELVTLDLSGNPIFVLP